MVSPLLRGGDISPCGASTFLNDQKGTKESPGVGVRKTFGYASVFSATLPPDPHLRGRTGRSLANETGAGGNLTWQSAAARCRSRSKFSSFVSYSLVNAPGLCHGGVRRRTACGRDEEWSGFAPRGE